MYLGSHWNYASKWRSVLTKVVVQQLVFTPIFNTYFFGMQAVLTGQPMAGVVQRIKDTVPTSIINSCKVWPAVTAFSFAFIMPQYRFMFSGIFAVVWQTYLSFLNRREEIEGPTGTLADQGRQELFEASVAEGESEGNGDGDGGGGGGNAVVEDKKDAVPGDEKIGAKDTGEQSDVRKQETAKS